MRVLERRQGKAGVYYIKTHRGLVVGVSMTFLPGTTSETRGSGQPESTVGVRGPWWRRAVLAAPDSRVQ